VQEGRNRGPQGRPHVGRQNEDRRMPLSAAAAASCSLDGAGSLHRRSIEGRARLSALSSQLSAVSQAGDRRHGPAAES
jgi:hypothetical protein